MAVQDNHPAYVARVLHHTPGRLRLRLPREALDARDTSPLTDALTGLQGVLQVRVARPASSLLVRYDPASVRLEDLMAALHRAGLHVITTAPDTAASPPGEPTALSRLIDRLAGQMDARVERATGHLLDLRTMVPLGLGALALREVLAGRLQAAPWYVLLWWSFDSYLKLRRRGPGEPGAPADQS